MKSLSSCMPISSRTTRLGFPPRSDLSSHTPLVYADIQLLTTGPLRPSDADLSSHTLLHPHPNLNPQRLGEGSSGICFPHRFSFCCTSMAAFMAALESDLRALSAEARHHYPAVKDAAKHAILKLRSMAGPDEIAHNKDIVRIFVMACEVKNVKLHAIVPSCHNFLYLVDARDGLQPVDLEVGKWLRKDVSDMKWYWVVFF